jgi:hypothetical protein
MAEVVYQDGFSGKIRLNRYNFFSAENGYGSDVNKFIKNTITSAN